MYVLAKLKLNVLTLTASPNAQLKQVELRLTSPGM